MDMTRASASTPSGAAPSAPTSEGLPVKLRETWPAWVASLLGHALLLAVMSVVGWAVMPPAPVDVTIAMGPTDAPPDESPSLASAAAPASRHLQADHAAAQRLAQPQPPAVPIAPTDLSDVLAELSPADQSAALMSDLSDGLMDQLSDTDGVMGSLSGIGIFEGASEGFGQHIARLRGSGLDLVLLIDATESMRPWIAQAKQRMAEVIRVVTGIVPDTRVGVVAFKDIHDDYGADAVRMLRLTDDLRLVHRFIDDINASGGGDIPEPLHLALGAAVSTTRMGWAARRQRVMLILSDAPIAVGGRAEAFERVEAFHRHHKGVVNVIDVGGASGALGRTYVQPDLRQIARTGGGSAYLLEDADRLFRDLIISIFGRRFENDIEAVMQRIHQP